ncbi:NAD(P)-dependent oxidoreductase [Vreelandella titanicae]|uniref:NAD(P)-dependent oxidoreductase n=1 Tax=Vreelandella titanicae TaxID=664683 RepID=UPI003159A7CE
MLQDSILLIGGYGIVGRWTSQFLRSAYPDVPLLIGGRNLAKAQEWAAELGNAQGLKVDLSTSDLGLGDRSISAVATLFMDDRVAALRFAQSRCVPHISISPGIFELGPEVAAYMHNPSTAPVVLGTEWLVGATTVPTLEFAKRFRRVHNVVIGALLDERDDFGPAAEVDLERQMKAMPVALARRDGVFYWRRDADAMARFRAVDGTEMEASALSPNDVVGLATVLDTPNVQFNLAIGESSSRRCGEPISTEIIIELEGEDHNGQALCTRHAIVHPQGQMPLTGLGVALVLERLTGLDGNPATPPGLYFPYQLLETSTYFDRLKQAGGSVMTLEG